MARRSAGRVMAAGRAIVAALATAVTIAAHPGPAFALPGGGDAPAWMGLRAQWVSAVDDRRRARWTKSIADIEEAERRAADAESRYKATLLAWIPDGSPPRIPASHLREAALDLIAWGEPTRASTLLEGALRDDDLLIPLRAAALGGTGKAAEGLLLLQWPPDWHPVRGRSWRISGSSPARGPARDAAHLLTASALCDSIGDARGARAALHALILSPNGGAAARGEARLRLATRCLAEGTPRLAAALIDEPANGGQALVLGEALAQAGDTVAAVRTLARFGTRSGMTVAERFPALLQAASWAAPVAPRLEESAFLDLCRTLGEVGEAARGLAILRGRGSDPADSSAAYARAETEAGLLARARLYPDAAVVYRGLAARPGRTATERARTALSLARVSRGAASFATMDSAFLAAVALDPSGAVGEQAAWERAREWEDARGARESADVFAWADRHLHSPALRATGRVHGALSWRRAGSPDSARAMLSGIPASDAMGAYWQGRLALAAGDTAAARAAFRAAWRAAPAAYEGIRAQEESSLLGAPLVNRADSSAATFGRFDAAGADAETESIEERVLTALGWDEIAADRRKRCARESAPPRARGCTDALEEAGVFRVGQRAILPEARLEYPPAHPGAVLRAAAAESLPPALLWGIMRLESAYDRQARSKAGAIGLLQLLPGTASLQAGRSVPEDSLTDAALNIGLGARYVRALLKEFGDVRAVLASYNAGEEAVRRWNRDRARVDDEWVERIPYRETRDYVKQVYAAWRRYEAIYGLAGGAPSP